MPLRSLQGYGKRVMQEKKSPLLYLIYAAIVALSVAIDQFTKYLAVRYLTAVDTVPLIKDILHLTYVENTGAAFGMMKDKRWLFMTVSVVAIVVIAFILWMYGRELVFASVCLAMVLGGGIGNMIDRIALGYVVDFIDFRAINFAVFNGADSFVCVGAFLLIIYLIKDLVREYKLEKQKKAESSSADEAEK